MQTLNIPVESMKTYPAVNAKGQAVHVQAYALNGVLHGVREDEGLMEYEVADAKGAKHLLWADSPKRAVDLVRYALVVRPVGEPRLVGEADLHPDCR